DHNQITGAAFLGTIGRDWQFSGVGNFNGAPGETDLLLRNEKTGGLEVYDIASNQITGAPFLPTLPFHSLPSPRPPAHAPGPPEREMRNNTPGAFEVYNIANNQITGAAPLGTVGLDWQLGGLATDPPSGPGAIADMSNDQLVQAMAGFDGGSGVAD